MKTKFAISAFVAALVLSACGSKTDAPAPTTEVTVNPPPASAPADSAASAAADSAAAASAAADAASSAASAAAAPKP